SLPPSSLFPYTTLFRSNRTDQTCFFIIVVKNGFQHIRGRCFTVCTRHADQRHIVCRVIIKVCCNDRQCPGCIRYINNWYRGRYRSEEHTSELQSRFDLV